MEDDHDDDTSNVRNSYFHANDDDNSKGSSIAKEVSFPTVLQTSRSHKSTIEL